MTEILIFADQLIGFLTLVCLLIYILIDYFLKDFHISKKLKKKIKIICQN